MVRLRLVPSLASACLAVACLAVISARSAQAQPRAVIELFTSQGCSSCPPADKLIAEYSRDPSVIALSLAVDYWDYLGWKDTLALHGHSMRQRAYARMRGDRQVYTPQAVVDGAVHVLGSDKAAIERAIDQTRAQHLSLTVPVTMTQSGDKLMIKVPEAADGAGTVHAEVWLCPITKSVHVTIERGENTGHTFTYTNVVRRWIKLGDWTGAAETFEVSVKDFQNGAIDSAAVMVQSGVASAPKLILGAAQIPIQ